MFEMHTGTRPGRPALLVVLCAMSLVVAVCLAWVQVRESRGLGDEVRVDDSPLVVRPPKGWVRHPSDPATFVETVQVEGQPGIHVERRISFHYQRWSRMPSIAELLRYRNQRERVSGVSDLEPARVAGLDGVQIRRARNFRFGRREETGETVYRLAISPRGDEINVEYIPVRELTAGDLDLLDVVCAAMRIDDAALRVTPEQARQQTGVDFKLEPGWRIQGGDYPGVPNLFVQGGVRGIPLWAVGVFRTWLADERTPDALVRDAAMSEWLVPPESFRIESTKSGDCDVVSAKQPPGLRSGGSLVTAISVVSKSDDQSAMLVAYADPRYAADAQAAASEIATSLTFRELRFPASIERAAEVGARLAEGLGARAIEQWGTEQSTLYFRADHVVPPDYRMGHSLLVQGRVGSPGTAGWYEGVEQVLTAEGTDDLQWRWRAKQGDYEWRSDRRSGPVPMRIEETRSGDGTPVRRTLVLSRSHRQFSISPGPNFVSKPLESLAESWVAGQTAGEWLISASTVLGAGAHSRLLVPLPKSDAGQHRTLLLDDYQPRPTVLGFDDAGDLATQQDAGSTFHRISAAQADILQRQLR